MARRSTAHWPRVRGDASVSRPRARAAGSRTVRRLHHCCAASCLCSRKSLPSAVAASRPPRLGIVSSRGLGVACRPGWKPGCAGPAWRVYGLRGVRTHPLAVRFSGRAPLFRGTRLYEDLEITYLFRGLEMAEGSLSLRYSMERSKCRVTNVSVQPSPCFLGSSVSPFPSSVNRIGEGSFPFGNGKSVILFFEGFSVLCAKS